MGSIITATGSVLPARKITNDFFNNNQFYKKDGTLNPKPGSEVTKKLKEISGITERRFLNDDQDSVDLLVAACSKVLEGSSIDKNSLDAVIVAHNSGNMLPNTKGIYVAVPNLSSILKNRLNITNHECVAYDILFGCPGWLQAVIQANRLILAGEAKHILVAGVEVASRLLDPHDVDSLLMADGCGAIILSVNSDTKKGIQTHATFSHNIEDLEDITQGPSLNKNLSGLCYFKMDGKKVYRYATTWLPNVIKKAMDKVNITPKDVDYFFFHQANGKMLKVIARNLFKLYDQENEDYEKKIPISIEFLGNTSVATIPTLIDLVNKNQMEGFKLEKNQTYVFASVGAGMHCNAMVYKS